MQKHFLTVPKTARYFTKGNLDENTQYIWIVIHGYAQTADSFLNSLLQEIIQYYIKLFFEFMKNFKRNNFHNLSLYYLLILSLI